MKVEDIRDRMDLANWLYEQFCRYPNNPQWGMMADDLWPLISLHRPEIVLPTKEGPK